jgi:DNA-binding transcriptional regulator LsrR (DeoR family)
MARSDPQGPAQLVLTASVARRYYLDGKSKIEIADELHLSRFKVARLLEAARTSGLVKIEIGYPGAIDVEASSRLQDAFGLTHSIVIHAADEAPDRLLRQLGSAAADLIGEIVTADDVLGLSWARSVAAMHPSLRRLAACTVVQLTGALSRPDIDASSIELVRDVARVGGGPAYMFYAPMLVPEEATATALRQQPDVARAIERFGSISTAVVGIGAWSPGLSTVYDVLDPAEAARLARLGACAEVSGSLLTADGTSVDGLESKIIGVTAEQLRAIPEVIGIAYGEGKARAVAAALAGGLVNGLVTHRPIAESLLQLGGRARAARPAGR